MAFCGKCGTSLSQTTAFCGNCGAAVSASEPEPVTSSVGVAVGSTAASPSSQPSTPAWSSAASQPPQNAGWSPIPQQPSSAPAATAGTGWTAVPAGAPAAAWNSPVAPPASAAGGSPLAAAGTGLSRNLAGALAYSLGIITGILFMVLEPYRRDRFVRFHAMQSILYFVAAVAFSIAWRILVGILMSISGWIALASVPIRLLVSLAMFCLWLFLMYQAYSGREFGIPILGPIARKQADSQL